MHRPTSAADTSVAAITSARLFSNPSLKTTPGSTMDPRMMLTFCSASGRQSTIAIFFFCPTKLFSFFAKGRTDMIYGLGFRV